MEHKLILLVNAFYKEWLLTHDPYEDDFETELKKLDGIDRLVTLNYNIHAKCNEWILLT